MTSQLREWCSNKERLHRDDKSSNQAIELHSFQSEEEAIEVKVEEHGREHEVLELLRKTRRSKKHMCHFLQSILDTFFVWRSKSVESSLELWVLTSPGREVQSKVRLLGNLLWTSLSHLQQLDSNETTMDVKEENADARNLHHLSLSFHTDFVALHVRLFVILFVRQLRDIAVLRAFCTSLFVPGLAESHVFSFERRFLLLFLRFLDCQFRQRVLHLWSSYPVHAISLFVVFPRSHVLQVLLSVVFVFRHSILFATVIPRTSSHECTCFSC